MAISFVAVNVAAGQSVGTTTTSSAATPANRRALYKDVQVGNAAYRAVGVTLPRTTLVSKTLYVGCVFNGADSVGDVLAVGQQD